ncbi:TlpA family protein disulfide reductase [Streptomyces sp. NPDC059740]|uniref:TlpA family protein disulfide reductase n=1 Tax=Streptomyces sp. NPDC059740 TaxID=3346926 RepID=UPI003660BB5F
MSACRSSRRLSGRSRTALPAAGAALASLLLLSACGSGTSGGGSQTNFVQGKDGIATVPAADRKPAPELSGPTTRGKHLDVSAYRGKVIVLNVWGSWCSPCNAEAANLDKVARDTKAKGVQFVGINTRDDDKAQAVSFEQRHKVGYPSLFDPTGKLLLRFSKGELNPDGIPSTLVIDRKGRLAARYMGPLTEEDLRKMVDPLIAEK